MNTQTQIKVLEAAKIVYADSYNSNNQLGLCYAIKTALKKYCPDQMIISLDIPIYIPLFTIENAKKYGKAVTYGISSIPYHNYWWNTDNSEDRVAFLNWMILVLKAKEGLPIKTQIKVFKKVKWEIIKRVILNHLLCKHSYYYLCTLTYAFSGIPILPKDTEEYFPLLTYRNAVEDTKDSSNITNTGQWWPKEDFLSRLRFLNKTIKQLKSIQNV